ncbi:MAG: ABC transporter ATP-binding protein [Prochloraceae cyanobacterium]
MAKVKLQGIARKFGNVTAIEEISFEVPDGEFWVLVGPSGCGKSTILRAIAGLESVTAGKIYIGDTLVNQVPARQRDVAMVFQNYALYPHMSVADNLAFGLRMRQVDAVTIAKRVKAVARGLNIEHLLKRKPKQLSGGQQQRVALGRAIARQPKLFLLDEPLSNLDTQLRDDTRAELKQLHARLGITTIYVTHDQVEAMTLADKIVVLSGGRIQQIASPQEIYAHPTNQMVAAFLGSPPMNIVPVTYMDGSFVIHNQSVTIKENISQQLQPREGQAFNLGIRPEHIVIASHKHKDELDEPTKNFAQLTLNVEVVEPLGRETLVRGSLPGCELPLNLHAPAYWRGEPGDRLVVQLDLDLLFVFDASTGKTFYPKK